MKLVYKFLNGVTNILTGSIILCAVLIIGALYVPGFFGTNPYIVLSGSMEPVIHTGSLVYISETDEPFRVGDIIGYVAGETPVVHRIVGEEENGFITQGDANDAPDLALVTKSEILGKCVLTVPGAGYVLSSLRSHVIPMGSVELPIIIPLAAAVLFLLYAAQYCIDLLAFTDDRDTE